MTKEQLKAMLAIIKALSDLAEARSRAKDAIAGALSGGIPTHAPIQTDAQADAASLSEIHAWANSWDAALEEPEG